MATHAVHHRADVRAGVDLLRSHWAWLPGGIVLAFAVPYVLADLIEINRDLYYGIYALFTVSLFVAWARATGYDLRSALRRHLVWAIGLGAAFGAVLVVMVLRTEEATARPDGLELLGAVAWRGIVYGLADGLLLSAFPILIVFAAMAATRLNEHLRGKLVIGALALLASIVMTAAYHAGYSDFRSEKITKPVSGDVIWSVPTLVTLNPIGAPIAHAGLHTGAVLHSYETETFLPPHR